MLFWASSLLRPGPLATLPLLPPRGAEHSGGSGVMASQPRYMRGGGPVFLGKLLARPQGAPSPSSPNPPRPHHGPQRHSS